MPGRRLRVTGRVQGVGFRPFVWRLATGLGLAGTVQNYAGGVLIEIWGGEEALAAFARRLRAEAPALARIDTITGADLVGPGPEGFAIAPSGTGTVTADIPPDTATCPACFAEVLNPADRRHGHAFAACTDCGPRYTIATAIPYDRAGTTMAGFPMCPACAAEYADPADRRFHAQPIACPACGPRLWIEDETGAAVSGDPVGRAAAALVEGRIVAIQGIGGFHLACDATSAAAVARLRHRKRRPDKPLAVMVADLAAARDLGALSDAEAAALAGPAAPIVLLAQRTPLPGIAPGLAELGVMLPTTPLHHLLARAVGRPLVLTSGNLSGAPPATDTDTARRDLAGIADLWLMHDRAIAARADDSVLRLFADGPVILRRARGLAPEPFPLPEGLAAAPPVLAMGGDLKAGFCLAARGQATMPPEIGDLGDARTRADYRTTLDRWLRLHDLTPARIAVDLHPDYASARLGRTLAAESGASVIAVQHHHAHLAACLAENGLPPDAAAVGIILDGTGLGTDGTIWGGEILVGGYGSVQRVAHLPPVALPGGAEAVRDPWRNTVAHLRAAFGPDWQARLAGTPLAADLAERPTALIAQMIDRGVNAPASTSAGRLFDAVAGALGLGARQSHEGQAAMRLEALAQAEWEGAAPYPHEPGTATGTPPGLAPMWAALLSDLRDGQPHGRIAARFHRTLAGICADLATGAAAAAGLSSVALSGGVFHNRLMTLALSEELAARGLRVLRHRRSSPGDGSLALGQAAIAAAEGPTAAIE